MENNNFTTLAENALGQSPIIASHEKMSTDDVMRSYPNGITLIKFDVLSNDDDDGYAVFNFVEDDTKYINGGALLTKIAFAFVEAFNGDVEKASEELEKSGGVRVKLESKRTKKGNNITNVIIVK